MSSKPTTETCSGTDTPAWCSCLMAPIAMSSLLATRALKRAPRPSRVETPAAPQAGVHLPCAINSSRSGISCRIKACL
ncbi:hypothetical protein D3C72_1956250 [compost metagenome]